MRDYDYIVLVDENGQPYIMHGFSDKARKAAAAARSKAHKYIAKWGEGTKARYFYTKEQLEAAMHQGRQKVSDATQKTKEKASDVYAKGREALATEKQKVSEIATKVPERLKDTVALRDKATGAIIKGQEAVKKIEDNAKNLVEKAKDVAKDTIGITARDKYNSAFDSELEAQGRYRSARTDENGRREGTMYRAEDAAEDAKKAYAQYNEAKEKYTEYTKTHPIISTKKANEMTRELKELEAAAIKASKIAGRYQEIAEVDRLNNIEAVRETNEALEEYLKTPLAFLDSNISALAFGRLKDRTEEKVSDVVDSINDKLSDKLSDKVPEIDSSLANDRNYQSVITKAESLGVEKKDVKKRIIPLSESQIIKRISGGDKTKGSCSSLALTYIANKMGYDVLDFRGGSSTELFSKISTIRDIAAIASKTNPGNAYETVSRNGMDSAKENLEHVEEGKEYYFAAGSHAAVIKKEDGKLYYLELQSPNYNGWKTLDDSVLMWRFGCDIESGPNGGISSILINTEAINNNFVNLFGYINTDKKNQQKGGGGSVK